MCVFSEVLPDNGKVRVSSVETLGTFKILSRVIASKEVNFGYFCRNLTEFFLCAQMNRYGGSNLAIGLCIATAFLVIAVRGYAGRKARYSRPGSVADLVRRGQLRSDRRGMYDPYP